MPTRNELETALRNADAAGDVEAARQLANALRGNQYSGGIGAIKDEFVDGANEAIAFLPDTAVELVNTSVGGLKGIVELLRSGNIDSAVDASRSVNIPDLSDLSEMLNGYRPGANQYMEDGAARSAVRALGAVGVPGGMAMAPMRGRNLATAGGATAELAGLGTAAPANALQRITDATINDSSIADNVARELAIKNNTSNPARSGYALNEVGRVIGDKTQQTAQKGGVSDDLIALVQSANPRERRQMLQMVDAVGEADPVVRAQNSPRMALADSMGERVRSLLKGNAEAYRAQRQSINDLRGIRLDANAMRQLNDGPMQDLQETLRSFNVQFDPAQGSLSFKGSSFETSREAQGRVRNMLNLLYSNQPKTAHDLHIFKENVDELIEWSVSQGGAKSKSMVPLKQVRSDINGIIRELSPDYASANDGLQETIPLINELQRLTGRNTDIRTDASGPALARLSRRILSNAQSAEAVDDVLRQLANYGPQEDVWRQNVFLDELDRAFGTQQRRSLQGEVSKGMEALKAAQEGSQSITSKAIDMVGKRFTKSPDQQQKEQLQALRDLIISGLK